MEWSAAVDAPARPKTAETAALPPEIEDMETTGTREIPERSGAIPVAPRGEAAARAASPPKGGKAKFVFLGLVLATGGAFAANWVHGRGKEATDDAQVEGRLVNVAPRVQGRVAKVLVRDNQLVEPGTVLVELEDDDLRARLDVAKADLLAAQALQASAEAQEKLTEKTLDASEKQAKGGVVQAQGTLLSSSAGLDQARADIVAADARRKLARSELERAKTLVTSGAATSADLDVRQAALDQAEAAYTTAVARERFAASTITASAGGVDVAKGRLDAAQIGPEQLEVSKASVALAKARVKQSEAAVHIAELNLSYVKVIAPSRGTVSRRTVEVGQMADPARPFLALVSPDDVWIVANFKEDQLAEMKPGQAATVTIDTYGGRTLTGHVDSLAGASGARFALLPPDNASGNFTKVVQRVPVIIRLDPLETGGELRLRPGLSATVTVRVK
jgi:membrane fusion protein (multidrug efflux system)